MFESRGDFVDKPPFEESLRALAARRRSGESHPGPEELVACQAGHLTSEEGGCLQEHLTRCRECARLLLDLAEFEQLAPSPEGTRVCRHPGRSLPAALQSRLWEEGEFNEEPSLVQHRLRPRVPLLWRNLALPWALATGLAMYALEL